MRAGVPPTSNAAARAALPARTGPSLQLYFHLHAAVHRIQEIRHPRVCLALADGRHLVLGDAAVEQETPPRVGAPLRQAEIVLFGAAAVGIALDDEAGTGELIIV